MSRGFRVVSYRDRGLNKREIIERSALRGEWLFGNWHTHIVAFHLCYTFGGEPVYYDDLWHTYLSALSNSGERFDAFKRVIGSLSRKGLIEGENLIEDNEEWEKCVREESERSSNDKRIKRSPEERCIEKLGHDYWIKAKPELCRLLFLKMKSKPGVISVRPPPILVVRGNGSGSQT